MKELTNKYTVTQIHKIIDKWEECYGESFVDYFVDDNINSVAFLMGYICSKFPDLGNYIMTKSNWRIVWKFVQNCYYNQETKESIDSISLLIEEYYNEDWNKYNNVWANVIHDIDPYYDRFIEWLDKQYIKYSDSEERYDIVDLITDFN